MRVRTLSKALLPLAAGALTLGLSREAAAQQKQFTLDRLMMAGAPDDGIGIMRPATQQRTILYGQLGVGYQLNPLRTSTVSTDPVTRRDSPHAVVQNQLTFYASAGFEILDRVILGVTLPVNAWQSGQNPNYGGGDILSPGQSSTTFVSTGGSAGDTRIDLRGVLWRSPDRKSAFGAGLSFFAPSGNAVRLNGDGDASTFWHVNAEHTIKRVTLVADTGLHFRPRHSINDPLGGSGIGVGNEWRWAIGGFVPLKDGKYRIGATIFGQTGIESDTRIIGKTAFTSQNSPIEAQVEGRMRFGPADHFWAGVGAGTAILRGYGAPDLRVVALIGTYIPLLESEAKSPAARLEAKREKRRQERNSDRDNDGIPDDIDACPTDAEDHLGSDPSDGCPLPPDKDGDGIPDQYDKCPDVAEDKDGVDDGDGCPEEDADSDGIGDAQDACPKEPGPRSSDAKKNGCPTMIKVEGDIVRIMQQVHFQTGSTTILPDSFPMLQEIASLLKANKGIKRMSIEGHTDNKGAAALNKTLSQGRANSVMTWLTQHGVEANRLEAHGYGLEKPIEDNATEKGRAANRRVEFKIVEQEDTNQIKKN